MSRLSSSISHDRLELREPKETLSRLTRFVKDYYEHSHAKLLVVGMSGGLDSSVVASISALAVGGRNVLGVSMPESETYNPKNVDDARLVAKKFRIPFRTVDISKLVEAFKSTLELRRGKGDAVWYGNVKARLRMILLYYYANTRNGLVVGTGDKSELMLGYYTKYGDGAADIQPLADMYKSSVQNLAKHLGLPARVYSKPPSPELWPGQTALKELGLDYGRVDQILWGLERWIPVEELADELNVPVRKVLDIRRRWLGSEHKRRVPLSPKLGFRTVGMDFRLPYSNP